MKIIIFQVSSSLIKTSSSDGCLEGKDVVSIGGGCVAGVSGTCVDKRQDKSQASSLSKVCSNLKLK